jgi:hypothetical protein
MMNDDFISRHRQQPDPEFVERLYMKNNTNNKRSLPMSKRIFSPAFIVVIALILATVLTFTIFPSARAAFLELFNFNGVSIGFDEETGKLITSGNTDSITEQTDNSVTIQDDNGNIALIGVATIDGDMINLPELLADKPDVKLPVVPEGYIPQDQVQLTTDGELIFTWMNGDGSIITYKRSDAVKPEGMITQANDEVVTYSWPADGYFHTLTAINSNLSTEDLITMVPD